MINLVEILFIYLLRGFPNLNILTRILGRVCRSMIERNETALFIVLYVLYLIFYIIVFSLSILRLRFNVLYKFLFNLQCLIFNVETVAF